MNRLERLQRELQEAGAAIAHAERTLAQYPDTPSAALTLRSITKRRENLETQFLAVSNELGIDVCSYRIELPDGVKATISGLAGVLGEFQKVFTFVYDAMKNGAKQKAKVSADVANATSFGFAYAFPGSVGVMMTMANDRLLIGKTDLDAAMTKTLALLDAKNKDQLQLIGETVGLPALRHVHAWALENTKAGFGANIVWQRDLTAMKSLNVQPQEIAHLASLIKTVVVKEEIVVIGELVHVDIVDKTFRMKVQENVIHGTFNTAISIAHPAQLPQRYKATLNVLQKVVVTEDEEEISYFLLRLDPVELSQLLIEEFSSI